MGKYFKVDKRLWQQNQQTDFFFFFPYFAFNFLLFLLSTFKEKIVTIIINTDNLYFWFFFLMFNNRNWTLERTKTQKHVHYVHYNIVRWWMKMIQKISMLMHQLVQWFCTMSYIVVVHSLFVYMKSFSLSFIRVSVQSLFAFDLMICQASRLFAAHEYRCWIDF